MNVCYIRHKILVLNYNWLLQYAVCLSNKHQSGHPYKRIYNTISFSVVEADTNVLLCKDASYEYPFIMDVDLDFYRSQHDKLVGREWLLSELDEKMFFSKRGVLLLAEMGYGKSAIVAHLICQSDKRFPGNWIHQHIVAFHICNFYSRKTLTPGNFVKNLAGGFSKQIPGFLQILEKNSRYHTYFENNICVEDPEGCLDLFSSESVE